MATTKEKLFFIINRLSQAGGSVDALTLAIHLAEWYEVTVVYGEKEPDETDALIPLTNAPIQFKKMASLRRSIHPFWDTKAFTELYKLLKKEQPHIVHTHGFKPGLLGRMAAKLSHVPVIVHTFHGHVFHSYYNNAVSKFIVWVERKLASISTFIVAISPQQFLELSDQYKIASPAKIKTIAIGIDEDTYANSTNISVSFREQYKLPPNAIVVAIIGRLVPIKNVQLFIDIATRVLLTRKDVYFIIVGEGTEKSVLQKRLSDNKIWWQEGLSANAPANIIFTSWISHIEWALRDINFVLLTSLNEGTPVSLLEAQLFQIPVIASNVGGVKDTLVDGETGYLIDHFNIEEYIEKLYYLIAHKEVAQQIGLNGKAYVRNHFSKRKEVCAIHKLYTTYLENIKRKS